MPVLVTMLSLVVTLGGFAFKTRQLQKQEDKIPKKCDRDSFFKKSGK